MRSIYAGDVVYRNYTYNSELQYHCLSLQLHYLIILSLQLFAFLKSPNMHNPIIIKNLPFCGEGYQIVGKSIVTIEVIDDVEL